MLLQNGNREYYKKITVQQNEIVLEARIIEKTGDSFKILFNWSPGQYCFADIIEAAGVVPLPPYIKRHTEIEDVSRYQTIYALQQGSVAAPTAGLHFTNDVVKSFAQKNPAGICNTSCRRWHF